MFPSAATMGIDMGNQKNLVGKIFGKLKVLKRKRENNRTYYYCKCDCGNELWMRADSLQKSQSCGCVAEKTKFKAKDITGLTFGRLKALEKTEKRDKHNGSVIWKCQCNCKNITYVSETDLSQKIVSSCGCLGKENSRENMKKAVKKHLEEHIVEETNVPAISRKTVKSNNTSGFTGVTWDGSRNKWKAVITFKKKIYYLGRYDEKEDAIKIRKKAEEKYHKSFLDWYYSFSNK